MLQSLITQLEYFRNTLGLISVRDILEMLVMAYIIYKALVVIKDSKAWILLRGIAFVVAFTVVAYLMQWDTILYLAGKSYGILATAILIIFQPELRRFLTRIGENANFLNIFSSSKITDDDFTLKTVEEIVRASFALGRTRTGALIVIENKVNLSEYVDTGITVDGVTTSQLLINVFEHNTPLHDGAVVIRGNRLVAATCYLPLSQNSAISKALGTRHRAGLGISELTDSITVIVSEETGHVSVAERGRLTENLDSEALFARLETLAVKEDDSSGPGRMIRRRKNNGAEGV